MGVKFKCIRLSLVNSLHYTNISVNHGLATSLTSPTLGDQSHKWYIYCNIIFFFSFPTGSLLNEWLRVLDKGSKWQWTNKLICSEHFSQNDIIKTS